MTMQQLPDPGRINQLYQMLLEMATGNFSFRNAPSDRDDEMEELTSLLNALANQMQAVLLEMGFVMPRTSYHYLLQLSFILNRDCTIRSFSSDVPAYFANSAESLMGRQFAVLVSDTSIEKWEEIKQGANDPSFHTTAQLILMTAHGKYVPYFCTISRLLYTSKILVSAITIVLDRALATEGAQPPDHIAKRSDAVIIQGVYDYILAHLERPLPTVKKLSRLFGTNEYKLKEGFRHFFNTSIHQFYNEERLKRAHLMIQQTDESIKNIALMNGFNYYVNFGKAFKKYFGYAPSKVKRDFESMSGDKG